LLITYNKQSITLKLTKKGCFGEQIGSGNLNDSEYQQWCCGQLLKATVLPVPDIPNSLLSSEGFKQNQGDKRPFVAGIGFTAKPKKYN
jgi:hypothetical protein